MNSTYCFLILVGRETLPTILIKNAVKRRAEIQGNSWESSSPFKNSNNRNRRLSFIQGNALFFLLLYLSLQIWTQCTHTNSLISCQESHFLSSLYFSWNQSWNTCWWYPQQNSLRRIEILHFIEIEFEDEYYKYQRRILRIPKEQKVEEDDAEFFLFAVVLNYKKCEISFSTPHYQFIILQNQFSVSSTDTRIIIIIIQR